MPCCYRKEVHVVCTSAPGWRNHRRLRLRMSSFRSSPAHLARCTLTCLPTEHLYACRTESWQRQPFEKIMTIAYAGRRLEHESADSRGSWKWDEPTRFIFVLARCVPMRWATSSLAVEYLLVGATTVHSFFFVTAPPRCCCSSSSSRPATVLKRPRPTALREYRNCYAFPDRSRRLKCHRRGRRRIVTATVGAAGGGSGGEDYKRSMWKRRARRAMKYVSMPIVSIPGQPREQLMLGLPFPAANKTINFVVDTLRRTTMVTPATRDALGVGGATCEDWSDSFGECVELPAARIGKERGDHFLLVTDAIVANREQENVLGPNTGGVLGLDFCNTYDLDLNFETKETRVYASGAVDQGLIDTTGLEELSCGYLPGGKLGMKMELNGGGAFTAVLDLASNSTAGNWLAARDVDVTSMAQGQSSSYPRETGRSRPLMCAHFDTIQLGHVLLTSVVDAKTARQGRLAVYVGHLVEFESIAEDISGDPRGRQLALVGQDLIAHTRVVLSCRSKRLFFAPLEANDVWAGQMV